MAIEHTINGHIGTNSYHYEIHEGNLSLIRWQMTAQFVAAQLSNPALCMREKDDIIKRACEYSAAMFELRLNNNLKTQQNESNKN